MIIYLSTRIKIISIKTIEMDETNEEGTKGKNGSIKILNMLGKKRDLDFSNEIKLGDNLAKKENEIRVIELGNGIRLRLLSVNNSLFVDLRKFYFDHYTQRGIRVSSDKFIRGSRQIISDIEDIINNK